MVRLGVLIAFLLLAASPAAKAEGIVAVEVEGEPDEGPCAVPVPAGGSPACAAAYDANGTPDPGDDEIRSSLDAEEVRVVAAPPGAPPAGVALVPSAVRFEHPGFALLNATWVEGNSTLPAEVRDVVRLESRWKRERVDGEMRDSDEWGIFLAVAAPEPASDNGWLHPLALCWENCFLDDNPYLVTDYEGVQPVRDRLEVGDHRDSDRVLLYFLDAGLCPLAEASRGATCAAWALVAPRAAGAAGAALEATPRLAWDWRIERGALRVGPSTSLDSDPPITPTPAHAVAEEGAPVLLPRAGARTVAPGGEPAAPLLEPRTGGVPEGASAPAPPSALAATLRTQAPPGGVSSGLLAGVAALAILLGWLLYHRITRPQALDQGTRERIYALVRDEPGIRVGTLADRLGLGYNTVKHHVRLLAELGYLRGLGAGQKRWVATDAADPALRAGAGVLADPTARAVHDFLTVRGAADGVTVARELGLPASTVSVQVGRLREAGLVVARREGRRVVVAPRPG